MKLKKVLCVALACIMVAGSLCIGASAAEARATGKFNLDVKANSSIQANTGFLLDVGDSVTIRATYTPKLADLEFGLIAPNGKFYSLAAADGIIHQIIDVDERGTYYLAFRNNSPYTVNVSGNVDY